MSTVKDLFDKRFSYFDEKGFVAIEYGSIGEPVYKDCGGLIWELGYVRTTANYLVTVLIVTHIGVTSWSFKSRIFETEDQARDYIDCLIKDDCC